VIDSFRSEFPTASAGLGRLRLPRVAQEPAGWAFLSAIGASLIVAGILHVAVLALPASLQNPSFQWPLGATLGSMVRFASSVVLGAVLVRAGGFRAVLFYLAYVLLQIAVQLPGITLFCDRSGGGPDGSCRLPFFYIAAGRAPEWIGVAIGIAAARLIGRAGPGANVTLRGAGAYSLALFVLTAPFGLLSYTGAFGDPPTLSLLVLVMNGVAGAIGGIVLARARLGGALLVALAILGPSVAFAIPLVRSGGPGGEALELTVARWSSLFAPVLAAVSLLAARGFVRRRFEGTFF
jgi:hypothetical protein